MSYRVQFWKYPGRILSNYYEITPIWVLVVCDMSWMAFSFFYAGWNSGVHLYGKIPPNEKRSLINFWYQRKFHTITPSYHPLPELHKIYKEMAEKEREYNKVKASQ